MFTAVIQVHSDDKNQAACHNHAQRDGKPGKKH